MAFKKRLTGELGPEGSRLHSYFYFTSLFYDFLYFVSQFNILLHVV